MKKGYSYTILFAFIISLFFSAILGGLNTFYKEEILENTLIYEKRAILDSLGIEYGDTSQSIEEMFDDNIRQLETMTDNRIYEMIDGDGAVVAYSVKFTGKGLWGTIAGYIGIDRELEHIIALQYTEQNETPGLGGRIADDEFRNQFNNLPVVQDRMIDYDDDIQAITGATSSSSAVLDIVNRFIKNDLKILGELKYE